MVQGISFACNNNISIATRDHYRYYIFQTMNSVRSNNHKITKVYIIRLKDIVTRKFDFAANTQFL